MSLTYQALRQRVYPGKKPSLVALTVPHGAGSAAFLEAFPEIRAHPEMDACWPLFESYLHIEQDVGSSELAHAVAEHLAAAHEIPALVLEINYPRGIIDGGRLLGHCLRPCLPTALFLALKERFLALHQASLNAMPSLYTQLRQATRHALIDVHTMASYCPADAKGTRGTIPVSFPRLGDYVDQFLNAREHSYLRRLDLITEDEHGRRLASEDLLRVLTEALDAAGISWSENEPYRASTAFLSHQHLTSVQAISIDVPKHLLANWREDLSDYELSAVSLDKEKIKKLASCLGDAIARSL